MDDNFSYFKLINGNNSHIFRLSEKNGAGLLVMFKSNHYVACFTLT